MYGNTQFGS